MLTKISDLREKEIINIVDGRRLGLIKDIDIDVENGRITAIVLPGQGRFLGIFGRGEDYFVPWENIVRIGVDVILVETQGFTDLPHRDLNEKRGSFE